MEGRKKRSRYLSCHMLFFLNIYTFCNNNRNARPIRGIMIGSDDYVNMTAAAAVSAAQFHMYVGAHIYFGNFAWACIDIRSGKLEAAARMINNNNTANNHTGSHTGSVNILYIA